MPAEPYITVTLKKNIVKKLEDVNPDMPTSTIVTEAIQDYINKKSVKTVSKTSENKSAIYGDTGTSASHSSY